MHTFQLKAPFTPQGDQPKAIEELLKGIAAGEPFQTLLGVTGSGKTFTMANIIQALNRPTLIMSHNKTLAAQLYGEFKQFFPENAVEYFISYYDYYQPEAYIRATNTYIEKELLINKNIEKLRLSTTSSLLSGRRDVVVVASVSCIYGLGNPDEFANNTIVLSKGDTLSRQEFLLRLVDILYSRSEEEFQRGNFRVRGDTVEVFPAYSDFAYRVYFWGNEVEAIHRFNPATGEKYNTEVTITLFAANLFVTSKEVIEQAVGEIRHDLDREIKAFENEGRFEEAARLRDRTLQDLEMIEEVGFCSGIENYSRYFDRRKPGDRPFCLLDYFPDDFLLIVDESHVTIPQVRAMWGGDRSRKISLVDYGFRISAALDNRPLKFNEFESLLHQTLFVSATPSDYELQKSEGVVVEQIIRPTGLLDPIIEQRPTKNQIDDLLNEIDHVVARNERVLITTLTKRMAEELHKYFEKIGVRSRYMHSDIKTLDRVEILRDLQLGEYDVLVGVNMLREGLDLPQVSLVAILDADKEGFLRNERALIQTIGRAARNQNGRVLMYADKLTPSMDRAISETRRRRKLQEEYNTQHGITPKTVFKSREDILSQTSVVDAKRYHQPLENTDSELNVSLDPIVQEMELPELNQLIQRTYKQMERASKEMEFIEAARLRDEWEQLKTLREQKFGANADA
ncbi:MAG: excinuclease ABC subunit UvrB [Bernardetiaceae bacterium]